MAMLTATGEHVPTRLGFGGARGGAKSAGVRRCALALALKNPALTIAIVRRVYGDVKVNHIDPMLAEFPMLQQYYRVGDHELRLPDSQLGRGSRIVFEYAETKSEVDRKFWGPEYAYIFVDQAEQFSGEELTVIKTANRWPNKPAGFAKMGMFFNPGGIGTEYLRRVFWLRQYRGEEIPEDFAFIQAYGWDNYEWFRGQVEYDENAFYDLSNDERFELFIHHTQYGRDLNALPKALRAGHLMGSFESFEGQYFAGVWDESKCILTQAEVNAIVKPWWMRWMAQDWGFGDHASHGWYASGKLSPSEWMQHFGGYTDWPMDVVVRYREHVIAGRAEDDMSMDVVRMTPETERRYLSRFFFSEDGLGRRAKHPGANSVGERWTDTMRRYKMPTPEPADQDRVDGWRFMYGCLRQACLRGDTFTRERAEQGPAFFVCAECPQAIGSIPMATRDVKNNEDVVRVAGAIWEDVTDEIRYGLKSMLDPRTKAPREVRALEVYNSAESMTAKAMAMRKFEEQERHARVLTRRPRPR